jgi:hypothetical protein
MDQEIRRIQPLRSERATPLRHRPGAERSGAFRIEPARRDERHDDAGRREQETEDDAARQLAPPADDEAGSHLDVTA